MPETAPSTWPMSVIHRWTHGSVIRRGLYLSYWEAAVVAGMFAFTEAWLIPILAKQFAAPVWTIFFIPLLPQIANVFAGPWMWQIAKWFGGNRACAIATCWIQIVCLLGLLIPLQFRDASWALPMAITLTVALGLIGVAGGPAWVAWMGDMVPRQVRGRFQGGRATLFSGCKLAFALLFTSIVVLTDVSERLGNSGLQILVLLAAVSRYASWQLTCRQPELPRRPTLRGPESQRRSPESVGLSGFIRTMQQTDLGRWTLVWSLLHVGAMAMGPSIAFYMVKDTEAGGLGLSGHANWWAYSLLLYTSTIVRLLCYPAAGRLVDRFGAATCLRLAVWGIVLVPLPWVFSTNFWVLFAGEVFSGMCWCIAEIAVGTLLFNCHRDPVRRAELIGYHATVFGLGAVTGLLIGTVGSSALPVLFGNHFQTLFLLSLVLRLPALYFAIRLLPKLRPLQKDEHQHFYDLIPGVHLSKQVGRGLSGVFERTN